MLLLDAFNEVLALSDLLKLESQEVSDVHLLELKLVSKDIILILKIVDLTEDSHD